MKTVEIIGYKRANLGKADSKALRQEGTVPCVLYGGKEQLHFSSPMILFRDLVYTPEARFVLLNIEGDEYRAILQDIQFHPINEIILHADFLLLDDKKKIKLNIPVRTQGTAPGVQSGGKLVVKLSHLSVRALPKDMPEFIDVDVNSLTLGKSIRVGEIAKGNYEILNSPLVTLATVTIPRALKGKEGEA